MDKTTLRRAPLAIRASLAAALLATFGCSALKTPTAQSIEGLSPSGTVSITEDYVAGVGGGSGTLNYEGKTYPFRVLGTIVGPGGGLSKTTASGEVYKLADVSKFPGRYTQTAGKAGLSESGEKDLWLENGDGVIMHLQGTSKGVMLTFGKEEIFIRMSQ